MITTLPFLYVIGQVLREKFLEMLLLDRIDDALAILQKHMSKIPIDPALIHELTALLLCPDKKSLKHMAQWTGGVSSNVKSTKKASAVTITVKSSHTDLLMKLTHLLQLGTVRHGNFMYQSFLLLVKDITSYHCIYCIGVHSNTYRILYSLI
jgi:hypothetical protein